MNYFYGRILRYAHSMEVIRLLRRSEAKINTHCYAFDYQSLEKPVLELLQRQNQGRNRRGGKFRDRNPIRKSCSIITTKKGTIITTKKGTEY